MEASIILDFMCVHDVEDNEPKLSVFVSQMKEIKSKLEAELPIVPNRTVSDFVEEFMGVKKPNQVKVRNPTGVKPKGREKGKRIKSGREISMKKSNKKKSGCGICGSTSLKLGVLVLGKDNPVALYLAYLFLVAMILQMVDPYGSISPYAFPKVFTALVVLPGDSISAIFLFFAIFLYAVFSSVVSLSSASLSSAYHIFCIILFFHHFLLCLILFIHSLSPRFSSVLFSSSFSSVSDDSRDAVSVDSFNFVGDLCGVVSSSCVCGGVVSVCGGGVSVCGVVSVVVRLAFVVVEVIFCWFLVSRLNVIAAFPLVLLVGVD
ncbi:hypothetical protein Tco_0897020 [Tanacetum coccineum]